MELHSVVLAGTGSHVPEKRLTNFDLEAKIDTSNEWIVERTGIDERRIARKGVCASDLAVPAVEMAMSAAGVGVDDIDLIITGTSTPDMGFPSTSCFIQRKVGIKPCVAFDVTAACSGFLYAFSTAEQFIRAGSAGCALVVGAEVMSSIIDWEDRNTCVLFGDGAGAVVLERGGAGRSMEILGSQLSADGRYTGILNFPGGGFPGKTSENGYLKMKGADTFKMAVRLLSGACAKILKEHGLTASDIDLFVMHQANIRIIRTIAKNLNLAEDKVFLNISKYGNTSAASIPIALDEVIKQGYAKEGDLILLGAFGGGLTWGTALLRI